jgi:hypothetical protein
MLHLSYTLFKDRMVIDFVYTLSMKFIMGSDR